MSEKDSDAKVGAASPVGAAAPIVKVGKIELVDLGSARTETKGDAGGASDLPIKYGHNKIIP